MAMKALLLILAYMLVVTCRVSSFEDEKVSQYLPLMPPVCPPEKSQPRAPEKAPAYPPVKPRVPKHCAVLCLDYCKSNPEKRTCQRVCSYCCAKANCVPGKSIKCSNWDKVTYHDKWIKCP